MLGFRVFGSHREKKLALVAGEGLATWRRAAAVASVVAVATGHKTIRPNRIPAAQTAQISASFSEEEKKRSPSPSHKSLFFLPLPRGPHPFLSSPTPIFEKKKKADALAAATKIAREPKRSPNPTYTRPPASALGDPRIEQVDGGRREPRRCSATSTTPT